MAELTPAQECVAELFKPASRTLSLDEIKTSLSKQVDIISRYIREAEQRGREADPEYAGLLKQLRVKERQYERLTEAVKKLSSGDDVVLADIGKRLVAIAEAPHD